MQVALSARYRTWMVALFPATLGLGTAALWFLSRDWPLVIDESGMRLRSHRYVNWNSITKLSVSRSYCDGHASHIRLHHHGHVTTVPVGGLENGQAVVNTMVLMFKRTAKTKAREEKENGPANALQLLAALHRPSLDNLPRKTGSAEPRLH
jgi:hypothetical protein